MKTNITTKDVIYRGHYINTKTKHTKSLQVVGLDTEAYTSGKCFMIATSENDVFRLEDFPQCFFSRKYIGTNFVAYNLKYDESALLQKLTVPELRVLREKGKVESGRYIYASIPHKCLTVRRKKHSIRIYDMYNFYHGTLNYNAKLYLNETKLDIETKTFTFEYVKSNWKKLSEYCIQDAILVKRLADIIIKRFEALGIYPQKLFSTAYISFQYFRLKTKYVTVKRYWDINREVLDYAMLSYNGGKFEVTEKGTGYYYEYDIISAYPAEIANLVDISYARIVKSNKYRKDATYGFLKCRIKIIHNIYNPVAVKLGTVNIYPCGYIEKVLTKNEYVYLISQGVEITIIQGYWLHIDKKTYPYRKEIEKLMIYKNKYKQDKKLLDYHTVKIIMNSLYGKFVQLIEKEDKYLASTCWNPIYASIITANVRVKITKLQQLYPDIIAVHTDSIISKKPIPFGKTGNLGEMIYETEGKGVILGSGIYQIGEKTRFRGFQVKNGLFSLIDTKSNTIKINQTQVLSWNMIAWRNWQHNLINRFVDVTKNLNINFDKKRIWINDYQTYKDIEKRNVKSLPYFLTDSGI